MDESLIDSFEKIEKCIESSTSFKHLDSIINMMTLLKKKHKNHDAPGSISLAVSILAKKVGRKANTL